jgi:penicillin-binding protein 1A
VLDEPIEIELEGEGRSWKPSNPDDRFRGVVTIRDATRASLNVPFVRIARHCGFGATARRFRAAGLSLPDDPPPSFVLGSVEVSPLELAEAYGVFATLGRRSEARLLDRLALPGGRTLWQPGRWSADGAGQKVAAPATVYLVRDMLQEIAARTLGDQTPTEVVAAAFGKTGTTQEQRDAWFVGGVGEWVVSVWVGLDEGGNLGLSGSAAAGPVWSDFLRSAAGSYPQRPPVTPRRVVTLRVDEETGLLVRRDRPGSRAEVFRRGATPPYRRWFKADEPTRAIE